jgi:hypothetical protein
MRKIVQFYPKTQNNPSTALCDDGTLWTYTGISEKWEQVPGVPQDSKEPPAINKSLNYDFRSDVAYANGNGSPLIIHNGGTTYCLIGMRVPQRGELYLDYYGTAIRIALGSHEGARMIVERIQTAGRAQDANCLRMRT